MTMAANNTDNNELTPPPANAAAVIVVNNEGGRQVEEQDQEPLPPAPPSIALHHVNSTSSRTTSVGTASSGGVASGTAAGATTSSTTAASGGGGGGGALQTTPVLSGENIVLLSLSNDNTPNNYSHSSNASSSSLLAARRGENNNNNNNWNDGFDEVERSVMMAAAYSDSAAAALEEQEVTPTAGTLAESHVNKTTTAAAAAAAATASAKPAYSPPPDSIHSEQLQSLSPPPLSLQHHDGNSSSPHGGGGGSASIGGGGGGGSQSLFSGNNGSTPVMIAVAPSSISSNNNINNNNNGKQQKQRPPLPPRWAIGPHPVANAAVGTGNIAPPPMNIAAQQHPHPPHPLPPKQIGPLSHRRVLSTGDASLMSVLTDPDSESSPLPSTTLISTTVTTTTTATGATGMQQQQPATTSSSGGGPQRPPPVINRKRGVSWDPSQQIQHQNSTTDQFFGQMMTAVGQQVELDTLGILQPILIDNDNDNGGNDGEDGGGMNNNGSGENENDWMEGLMQPVLSYDNNDDNGREASRAVMRMEQQQQQQQQQELQPPLPPEHILPLKTSLQPKSPKSSPNKSSSNNTTNNTTSTSRRQQLVSTKSLRSSRKFGTSMTQFEDEANAAIMEALQSYHSEQSKIVGGDDGGVGDLKGQQEQEQMSIPVLGDNDEGVGGEEDNGGTTSTDAGIISVPHHVVRPTPTHRQDVSGITLSDGLDRSPRPPPASGLVTATFEDSAWHDGYDTAGRIDGTLVEERESKYIEEELGINLNTGSKISAAMNSIGGVVKSAVGDVLSSPLGQQQKSSSSSSVPGSDRESERSHGSKMSNASKASRKSGDQAAPPTGLRHRRTGTKGAGVLLAAQELAAMATIHESDEMGHSQHSHSRITSDGHGIDNLLAGATLLFKQEEKLQGRRGSENESMPLIEEENSVDVLESDDPLPHDEETGEANNMNNNTAGGKRSPTANLFGRRSRRERRREEQRFQLKMWYDDLIAPRLPIFFKAARHSITFVMIPLLFLAIVLYYGFSNPLTGGAPERKQDLIDRKQFQGSWSWWVLFLLRQFFILSCVKAGEIISIDIIALRTPIFVRVFGSFATLTFVQARGWPYVLTFWGVFDFLVLYGNNSFAKHWLFWQDLIGMCNQQNPPAAFLHGRVYTGILFSMIFVGAATSLKRLVIATFLGRRSFAHYGPELEKILAKMILVSQVAHLARRIEAKVTSVNIGSLVASGYVYTMKRADFGDLISDSEADSSPSGSPRQAMRKNVDDSPDSSPQGFGESLRKSVYGKKLISSLSRKNVGMLESVTQSSNSKMEILKFLEEWEEPDLKAYADSKASVKDILQFRQAISLMSDTYPFTQSFGPASTRAICVESASHLFNLLVSKTPHFGQRLPFETLSELAQDKDGELLRDKVKALVRLFRPDRKGFLTNVDFIRSIDSVYRELRLFRANLSNSQQIDDSFHGLINILHYFIVTLIVLIIMGFNNWESLLSMTTFFFSFSFMFGPASSKYFEGILLIFVRRPYDIGDKVAISPPDVDTSASGSSTWFVEKVSLYTTTVRFATTNEVATYSNGSLARLRIINAKRSPKAIVYVYNKFGSDVPFSKIQVFKAAVENFVKARPREWSALNGFRATRVEMELNFIEYVIVVTHRELWQNAGPILQSKADLASFSLEVSKRLGLRYEQPPKPIHLALAGRDVDNGGTDGMSIGDASSRSSGLQQVRDMFKKEE